MKRLFIFLLLILLLVLTVPAHAQGEYPPIPNPPPAGSYVLDTLDWLSPQQEQEINTIVSALDNKGLAEIAVVTLNDCGPSIDSFANQLFRKWGIGHANDDDGLLIIVCWYNGDKLRRKIRTEPGYGMEEYVPDLLTAKVHKHYFTPIWQNSDPEEVIRTGKAGQALVEMVKAYDQIIRGNIPAELQEDKWPTWLIVLLIIIVLLLLFIAWNSEDSYDGGSWSSGSWSSGSSGGSSWGSSGGGSSFGGGSSGGGGSSTGF